MDQIAQIIKSAIWELTAGRGMFFSLAVMLVFCLLPNRAKKMVSHALHDRCDWVALFFLSCLFLSGVLYLAYPNYMDHVESTILIQGEVLSRGGQIYPFPDYYPYHGLLYGPLLALIQGVMIKSGLPIMFASKVFGVFAYLLVILMARRFLVNRLAFGYMIILVPSSYLLFWNRAEPVFLLLVCLVLFLGDRGFWFLPICAGVLAGGASALKLHGVIYVFAAYVVINAGVTFSVGSAVILALSAAVAFFASFMPAGTSFFDFLHYIKLAGSHGLDWKLWLENVAYLVFLLFPVCAVWRVSSKKQEMMTRVLIVAFFEFLVSIIAAKPGAGSHHLLPFVPVNAYLIQCLGVEKGGGVLMARVMFSALIVPSLAAIGLFNAMMAKGWQNYAEASKEVELLDASYPGSVMGVTDVKNYPFVFLRVLQKGGQIDYPAYMDLQLSGVGDLGIVENLRSCGIRYLIMPNKGVPFSIESYYTGSALLTNDVRDAFSGLYRPIHEGKYYRVYACDQLLQK